MIEKILRRLTRRNAPPTLTSLDAYARWAATYPPRAHNPLMQAEETALLALLPPLAGLVVLDLASGSGRYGLMAWEQQARTVIALDNSREMLGMNPLPRRVRATVELIPLVSESVDVLICAMALGHLPSLNTSMHEIARVLRRGGTALISDFHPLLHFKGAKRTFNENGRLFAVEHYPHLYSDYHHAACDAGLMIDDVAEPSLDAGKIEPVVIVYRMRKR
jgi:malonyl-CoA O-methyltransferase